MNESTYVMKKNIYVMKSTVSQQPGDRFIEI